jgi:hypothetical protein
MNHQAKEVELCPTDDSIPIGECPLYKLRMGKNPQKLKISKQIRLKCLDCSGGSLADVRECWNKECELFQFKMGRNKRVSTTRTNKIGFGNTPRMTVGKIIIGK